VYHFNNRRYLLVVVTKENQHTFLSKDVSDLTNYALSRLFLSGFCTAEHRLWICKLRPYWASMERFAKFYHFRKHDKKHAWCITWVRLKPCDMWVRLMLSFTRFSIWLKSYGSDRSLMYVFHFLTDINVAHTLHVYYRENWWDLDSILRWLCFS